MLMADRVFGMDVGTTIGVGVLALVCAAILVALILVLGSGDRDP